MNTKLLFAIIASLFGIAECGRAQDAAAKPSIFVCGDSTAKNNGKGRNGEPMVGWGTTIPEFFNPDKVVVKNVGHAGQSSRTYYTNPNDWPSVLPQIKAGDFVLLVFGINDGGPPRTVRDRGSIPGLGDETVDLKRPDGTVETAHTYGWYMSRMAADAEARGAHVYLLTVTTRNIWTNPKVKFRDATPIGPLPADYDPKQDKIERGTANGQYTRWTKEIGQKLHLPVFDLTDYCADKYEAMGREEVNKLYSDHNHTYMAGAKIVAAAIVSGLKAFNNSPFIPLLSEQGRELETAAAKYVSENSAPTAFPPIKISDVPRDTQMGSPPEPPGAPGNGRYFPPVPENPSLPTLWIIGDSTVRNGTLGDGSNLGQWGWGAPIVAYFDPDKINVVNRAFGGTSSRSFYDGFFWKNLQPQIKKGDFVIMQFGANDGGGISVKGSLRGVGAETEDATSGGKMETVHTFGWYMQQFVNETREQGATPIICSYTPHKAWTDDGHYRRDNTTYVAWAAEVAESNSVPFVDLYELIARKYESLGTNVVDKLYVPSPRERLHTGWDGAVINARCVIAGLEGLKGDPLAPFFSARADAVAPVIVTPAIPAPAAGSNSAALYLDVKAPLDARVSDLISRLTLNEKAILLNHVGPTIERFNIRADQWNQCLNGVQWDRPTTLFPSCIAMSATWDTNLVHEVAAALSDEARAIYNGWHLDPNAPGQHKGLIYRDPVINIERNPYWGRNHEAWGEDPFLTGQMAVNYVEGLQGDDSRYLKIAATLKHFAVYNVETDRQKLNAVVPERMLHEYYLPHWREAIVEGRAQSVMASYNALNGTPNNINHWLLTDLLKNDWGFQGFVVSDLGGVRTMVQGHEKNQMTIEDAVAQSLMAGCDFSDKEFQDNIPAAVRDGKLTDARLDDAVARVLRVRFRLGEFDPFNSVPYSSISTDVINDVEHRALALKVADESIVLLQNRGGLLPLDKTKIKHIAVIGPLADRIVLNNYNGKTGETVTALQGIKDRVSPDTEVNYAVGGMVVAPSPRGPQFDQAAELQKAVELARSADVALVFVGTDRQVEQEGHDRKTLGLTGSQEELVEAVFAANPHTVVVEMSAGPLTVPWIKQHVPAMLQAWWPGEEGGHAIADILFGNVNPAGRLTHTVYASEAQVPPQDEYDITKGFTYMYVNGKPLFPFGHGLSYTTFKYSGLKLSADKMKAAGQLSISADVKNTGKRAGDEVVQLYVHQEKSNVKVPAKELRGFQRISLQPGEKQTVTFTLPAAKLAIWDDTTHGFVVQPSVFDVMVGASSADIRLKGQVEVTP